MGENDQLKLKSDSNHEKCDQSVNDVPQTSNASNLPDKRAHNMEDLMSIDFNSADEVRQRMKAIFAGKGPKFDESAEDVIDVKNDGVHEAEQKKLQQHLMSKDTETEDLKLANDNIRKTLKTLKYSTKSNTGTSRKRPGRPPKAGPSKKLKKRSVSTIYLGKLSNVVFSKRFGSCNGSDIESLDYL